MHRVLLADDSPPMRRALSRIIRAIDGWEVCGEAVNGRDAVRLTAKLKPDAILMDISMPGIDGIEAAGLIRKKVPGVKILILSLHQSRQLLERALRAGANGYVLKSNADSDLIEALNSAAKGQTYVSPAVENALAKGSGA